MRVNRLFAAFISVLYFAQNIVLASTAEANLWTERRRAAQTIQKAEEPTQNPSLAAKDPKTFLASLPSITPGIRLPLSNKALADLGIDLNLQQDKRAALANAAVPQWIQTAVAPTATIQEIVLSKDPKAKTVFLIQDAHLHFEAQTNIAATIDALAKGVIASLPAAGGRAKQSRFSRGKTEIATYRFDDQHRSPVRPIDDLNHRSGTSLNGAPRNDNRLLVGMEGARAGAIDLTAYDATKNRVLQREIARGLLKVNVLNGAEFAAIGFGGFDLTGVENQAEYDANLKALRDSVPLKDSAKKALEDLRRALVQAKTQHFDAELTKFDAKNSGYEEGSVGVPEYALCLDSIVPATTPNMRELIEAALLEGTIHFDKVERERSELIKALVPRISDEEVKTLLSLSTFFRAGQISYAAYYDTLKKLASRHDLPFSKFPEMNLYVQYVLKSEGIDHEQLFADIKNLEEDVRIKLARTPEQKEILALNKDYHLLKKLSDHLLIEDEWRTYEARRGDIQNLAKRLERVGTAMPRSMTAMIPKWTVFENFYTHAITRNRVMAENLLSVIARRSERSEGRRGNLINEKDMNEIATPAKQRGGLAMTNFAVLVAGGFHTQGLLNNLKELGLNVLVMSPKITQVGDGLSSIDVLASGHLPLDKLFVGEKLFLPTPSSLAAKPADVGNVIGGAGKAIVEQLDTNPPPPAADVKQGDVNVHAIEAKPGEEETQPRQKGGLRFRVERDEEGQGKPPVDVTAQELKPPEDRGPGDFLSSITGKMFDWGAAALQVASVSEERMMFLLQGMDRILGNGADDAAIKVVVQRLLMPDIALIVNTLTTSLHLPSGQDLMRDLTELLRDFSKLKSYRAQEVFRQTVGAVPGSWSLGQELQSLATSVADELGLSNSHRGLMVRLSKGHPLLEDLGEVLTDRAAVSERYLIDVSEELINAKVISPEQVRQAMQDGGFSSENEARTWLLKEFMGHEETEALLRKRSTDATDDLIYQKQMHAHLVTMNVSGVLPKDKSVYRQPLKDRIANAVRAKPDLFNDTGLKLIASPKPKKGRKDGTTFMGWPRVIGVFGLIIAGAFIGYFGNGADTAFSMARFFPLLLIGMIAIKEIIHRILAGQEYKESQDKFVRFMLRVAKREKLRDSIQIKELMKIFISENFSGGQDWLNQINSDELLDRFIRQIAGYRSSRKTTYDVEEFSWRVRQAADEFFKPRFSLKELGVTNTSRSFELIAWGEFAFFITGTLGIFAYAIFLSPSTVALSYFLIAFGGLVIATLGNFQAVSLIAQLFQRDVEPASSQNLQTVSARVVKPVAEPASRPAPEAQPVAPRPAAARAPAFVEDWRERRLPRVGQTLTIVAALKERQSELRTANTISFPASKAKALFLALAVIAGESEFGENYVRSLLDRLQKPYGLTDDRKRRPPTDVEMAQFNLLKKLFIVALDAEPAAGKNARFFFNIDSTYGRYNHAGRAFLLASVLLINRRVLPEEFFRNASSDRAVSYVARIALGNTPQDTVARFLTSERTTVMRPNIVPMPAPQPQEPSAAPEEEAAALQPVGLVAFFGNEKDIFKKIVDAILGAVSPLLTLPGFVTDLRALLKTLQAGKFLRAISPARSLEGAIVKLERILGSGNQHRLVQRVAQALSPVFGAIAEVTDFILEKAGLREIESPSADDVRAELENLIERFFDLKDAEVNIHVYEAGLRLAGGDVAFTLQRRRLEGHKTIFDTRITRQSLNRIVNGDPDRGLLGASRFINRAARIGVALPLDQARKLAVKYFLLRELGRSVLELSDEDLLNVGLADEARLVQTQDALPDEQLAHQIFVNAEGVVGQLDGLTPEANAGGSIKPGMDPATGEERRRAEERRQEVKVALHLLPATKILQKESRYWQVARPVEANYNKNELRFTAGGLMPLEDYEKLNKQPIDAPHVLNTMLNLLSRGFRHSFGGIENQETITGRSNEPTLVDESATVIHIEQLINRLLKLSNGERIRLPILMTSDAFTKKVNDAAQQTEDAQLQAAANNIVKNLSRVDLVSLTEEEATTAYADPQAGVINASAIEALLDRYAGADRAAITSLSILSTRPLTIAGQLSVKTLINVLIAVDVQVMGVGDRIAVEQVVFIQA